MLWAQIRLLMRSNWHLTVAWVIRVQRLSLYQKCLLHSLQTGPWTAFLRCAQDLLQCEFNRKAHALFTLQWLTLFLALAGVIRRARRSTVAGLCVVGTAPARVGQEGLEMARKGTGHMGQQDMQTGTHLLKVLKSRS